MQHGYTAEATNDQEAHVLDLGNTRMSRFLRKSIVCEIMGNHTTGQDTKVWEHQTMQACEDGDPVKDIVKGMLSYRHNAYDAPYKGEDCF